MNPIHKEPQTESAQQPQPDQTYDDSFVAELSSILNRPPPPPVRNFNWPPRGEDDGHVVPTAAPLYIPPPETQHIKTKPIEPKAAPTTVIDEVPASWLQPQTRSAPELTASNLQEHNNMHGNCSDNYTSTCTTTTATSDEYQRVYQTQNNENKQNNACYDQSSYDYNSNYDYEVCSYNQQLGSFSSASTDLMSFSGRRSVQECSESVFNAVNTSQLINYLKDIQTPSEELNGIPKVPKRVGFHADVSQRIVESIDYPTEPVISEPRTEALREIVELKQPPKVEMKIEEQKTTFVDISNHSVMHQLPPSNIPNAVPKEWTSLMCQALTTISDKPYKLPEVIDNPIEECNKPVCVDTCVTECPSRDVCQRKCSTENVKSECITECDSINICQRKCSTENLKSDCNSICQSECSKVEERQQNWSRRGSCSNAAEVANTCYSSTVEVKTSSNLTSATALEVDEPPHGSYMTSALTVASPIPMDWSRPQVTDDVPLPEPTDAYVPSPISMTPIKRIQHIGTKSPFLQALTIAPLKSYTPFENDVISQLEDLPTPKDKINLLDALTVAPVEPVHDFKPELPDETEAEKVQRIELEHAEDQAKEVECIIAQTLETELSKSFSAFAPFKGFRSVQPFKPLPPYAQVGDNHIDSTTTTNTDQSQSNNSCASQNIACVNESNRNSNQKPNQIAFPPPAGIPAKSYVQSGLQSPKTIPKYQRQWFNLASQSPVRTPEPQELKENVPIAFVEVPHETTETVSKPLAVAISVTDASEPAETSRKSSIRSGVSEAKEYNVVAQSLMNLQPVEVVAHRPPTPTHITHKPSALPYYQQRQRLVMEECGPTSGHIFEPNIRSPSPRPKSPAPGPPPNPLKIHAPRVHTPEPLDHADLFPASIVTGQSGLKLQNSAYQSSQSAMQSFTQQPESVRYEQYGATNIETRSKESQYQEANKSDVQSSSTMQIGNTQVQRNRRVVEEFERSQTSKTIEIHQSTGGQDAAALLINRASNANANATQGTDDIDPVDSYSKGFVARQARRLSENTVYKSNLAAYQSAFPHMSPTAELGEFPIRGFTPKLEEPKEASYHQIKPKPIPKLGVAPIPLPGYQQVTLSQPIGSTISSPSTPKLNNHNNNNNNNSHLNLTKETYPPAKLTRNSVAVLPTAACVVAAASTATPLTTTSNAYSSNQTTIASKSTSVSVSGLNLTNTNTQSVVSDPSPASAGLKNINNRIISNNNANNINANSNGNNKGSTFGATSAPKRGRGVLNKSVAPGARVPQCGSCFTQIR